MCSQRKLESSRANGAKSHGPITPEGKARSSMNALQHGFSAATLVLSVEERPQFEALREAFYDKFDPADAVECNLVDQIAAASWRQQRIWAAETSIFDIEIEIQRAGIDLTLPSIDASGRYAMAFKSLAADSPVVRNMERYENNCSRQFERAVRTFLNLRKSGAALNPPREGPREMKLIWCGHKHRCDPDNPRPDCNWRREPEPENPEPWDGKTKITEYRTDDPVGQDGILRSIGNRPPEATTPEPASDAPPATPPNEPNPKAEHPSDVGQDGILRLIGNRPVEATTPAPAPHARPATQPNEPNPETEHPTPAERT